jgi:hypothetical protein
MSLRGHPFHLARKGNVEEEAVVCVDEESECFRGGPERFFEEGQLSAAVQEAIKFQTTFENARTATLRAAAALEEAGVIIPWSINIGTPERQLPLVGLSQIDRKALDQLNDQQFLQLRKAGALHLAYCQLVSTHQLSTVTRLGEIQQRLRANPAQTQVQSQIADLFKRDDQTITF